MSNKVSICIPTYGMKGKGAYYIQKNLSSIFVQNVKPFEIIISDHSSDDSVEEVVSKWKQFMNIKYFRNTEKIGCISANFNNCLKHVQGDIVDFMLQDDMYYQTNSLQKRIEVLGDSKWSVTATIHYSVEREIYYWHLVPSYRDDIYLGFNSIGSPSLLTMRAKDAPLFDENLFMLTDCDYYKQLYNMYGLPRTSSDVTVVSVMWDGQSQKDVSKTQMENEVAITKHKFENAK